MNISKLKKLTLILILVSMAFLYGCTNKAKEETINIVGSTSVSLLAEELGDEFSKQNPEVKVDVQGVGSTAGIKATIDEIAEVGISSRDLKDEEKDSEINEHIIAYDGIVIVVNPENKVEDLDLDTISKIFTGEIENWKEAGGEDEEILIIQEKKDQVQE